MFANIHECNLFEQLSFLYGEMTLVRYQPQMLWRTKIVSTVYNSIPKSFHFHSEIWFCFVPSHRLISAQKRSCRSWRTGAPKVLTLRSENMHVSEPLNWNVPKWKMWWGSKGKCFISLFEWGVNAVSEYIWYDSICEGRCIQMYTVYSDCTL